MTSTSNANRHNEVAPTLRTIFPNLTDAELEVVRERVGEYFRFLYLRYQDQIEEAIVRDALDK